MSVASAASCLCASCTSLLPAVPRKSSSHSSSDRPCAGESRLRLSAVSLAAGLPACLFSAGIWNNRKITLERMKHHQKFAGMRILQTSTSSTSNTSACCCHKSIQTCGCDVDQCQYDKTIKQCSVTIRICTVLAPHPVHSFVPSDLL